METPKKRPGSSQVGKKVSEEVLLKRKLGRIKAAETMALKIKNSGITKTDNGLVPSLVRPGTFINQKNYYTDYLKKDEQISFVRKRKEMFGIRKKPKQPLDNKQKEKILLNTNKKSATPLEDEDADVDVEDEEDEDIETDITNEKDLEIKARSLKTIVVHPGSRNIRIGFVNDPYPKTIPNVIAVPRINKKVEEEIDPEILNEEDNSLFFGEEFLNNKLEMVQNFRERMRYYKRRILPNSNETVKNYNKKITGGEILNDLNDPYKIDWIKNAEIKSKKYLIGDDALKLENYDNYELRWPVQDGFFNENEEYYRSSEEILGDIQLILNDILIKEFDVKDFKDYNIVLVIPDLYDKKYVENFINLLFQMNFNAISIIQESIAATFGAGISQACVIDIGSQTTKISCVDEGMILNDSRIRLNYGGDDITKLFYKLLLQNNFPIKNLNFNKIHEFKLIEGLKEKYVTFEDSLVAVQLYEFTKRLPGLKTEKFQFKIFDEVMLSPMGLFYPKIFNKNNKKINTNKLFKKSIDIYSGKLNNPTSLSQKNSLNKTLITFLNDEEILKKLILINNEELNPNNLNLRINEFNDEVLNLNELELSVIESITNASKNDFNNFKKYYENLLIIGGGSKIPNIESILIDRINIFRPRCLSIEKIYDVLKIINDEYNFQKKQQAEGESNPNLLDDIIKERSVSLLNNPNENINSVEVLSSPKDIDPQILAWKGGAVFGRLKIVNELWITRNDWDGLGSRTLHYKALFSY